MKLEPHELESATAKKLLAFYTHRLATYRGNNDGVLDGESTARLRGKIAEVKGVIALLTNEHENPALSNQPLKQWHERAIL